MIEYRSMIDNRLLYFRQAIANRSMTLRTVGALLISMSLQTMVAIADDQQSPGAPATPPSAVSVDTAPSANASPTTPQPQTATPAESVVPAPMMPPAPAEAPAAKAQIPHNLSPWGMFLAADNVVKAVMISLAIASVLVWTAWFAKLFQVALARRKVRAQLASLDDKSTLTEAEIELRHACDPVAAMVQSALREVAMSESGAMPADGIKERVTSRLARIEAAAGRAMNTGTGLLATVGGTAPFIGLFGTVWGIMNSFIGISKAQTTNLAVVAPGIAEALLATAIGLVAAIPAVIFYNQLARSIGGYKAALADASAVVERHLSRDLDRSRAARGFHRNAAE